MRKLLVIFSAILASGSTAALANFSDNEVRIALMTDMSSIYSHVAGQGAVTAAELAIEDMGGKVAGKKLKLIVADHKSDHELAERLAQQLVNEHNVDVFAEMISSNTALAVQRFARDRGIVTLHTGSAASSLTSEECSPTGIHWTYDSVALARGTARAIMEQGGDSWFFLVADYAFGHRMVEDTRPVIEAGGGRVVGSATHPFKGSNFSSVLLQAQESGAKILAMANAGGDTRNMIKQAYELGILQGEQSLVGLVIFLSDIRQLGLYVAGGLKLTTGFYWNLNEDSRAWARRYYQRTGAMPTMVQAGVYSSLMHYFKAIAETGTDHGKTVVDKMKTMPVNDFFARNGVIRADGRMVHDMYLVEVKKPSESNEMWDYYKVLKAIPGEQAFLPLRESKCPYLKQ